MAKFYQTKAPIEDERGYIQELLPIKLRRGEFGSVALITGKRGAVRANHWHHTDSHYCVVTAGEVEYAWRGQKNRTVRKVILFPGDVVYTPPLEVHRFKFLRTGSFVAMSENYRSQKNYESDTVRENV